MSFVAMLSALSPSAGAATTPSLPSNLTVTAATDSSITLTWGRSYADGGIQGYQMTLSGVYVGWSPQLPGATQLSYVFNGLSCGKSYTLGVTGVNLADTHGDTATLIAATSPCGDSQAPSAPGGVVQIAKSSTSATVSWSPSSDNIGVVGYGAYQGGIRIGETAVTSYTFANLPCGTSTTVGLDAYDAAGNRSGQTSFVVSTSACSDTQSPSDPTNLTKTGSTETSISLSWSTSIDNVGVAYYAVSSNGNTVATTPQAAYTISGLACGSSYTVGVRAYDAAGNHSAQPTATMTTSACPGPKKRWGTDTTPPSVPTSVNVMGSTQTSVSVSWSASTDNVGVAGYGAYQGGTRLAQTAQTSYTFTGLACGKSVTLGIDAYDAAGNRSSQASVIASTSACSDTQAPSVPTNLTLSSRTATSISLTWSASSDNVGVVGYGVYKGGASAGTSSSTSYTVTGLVCGTTYTIGVDAYDASGNRSSQAVVMMATTACADATPPSAPTNLTTSNVGQIAVTLSWTASTDNVAVAGYDIFANGTKIGASTTATSNTLAGLTCGAAYTLGVEAFDAAGNRSTRSTKSVTLAACSAPTGGNVYISPSGNDSNPCTASAPCATFNRGYKAAQPGQTVAVKAGTYNQTDALYEAVKIDPDSTKTSSDDVTFVCADGEGSTVTNFSKFFQIRAKHLTFKGGCFRLHGVLIGRGDDSGLIADDVTLDGVHVDYFDAAGAQNLTIRNSEIGPVTACYAPGDTSKPANTRCQNNAATGEQHYYQLGTRCQEYCEPKVRGNSGGTEPSNVTLEGNWFHDVQTREPIGMHNGCFMYAAGGNANLVMRGNKFERCVAYDTLFDFAPNSVTLENNWYGTPYDAITYTNAPVPNYYVVGVKSSGASNWLVRFNTLASHFYFADGPGGYSNLRYIGNIQGDAYCESSMGSWSHNVFVGGTCGANSQSASSLPVVSNGSSIDYHLTGGSAVDFVSPTGTDYTLGSDFDGQGRPSGPARDAGADER